MQLRVTRSQALAIQGLVVAAWVVWVFIDFHRWQDRALVAGFMVSIGAVMLLVRCLRRRRDWLTWAVFAVTAAVLGVMTVINSYSTRFHLVAGVIMLISGALGAAVAGIREYRIRRAADIPGSNRW
jgi:thiol:disulfide interchange protein